MNKEQKEICISLGMVTYLPGSFDKRFARNLHSKATSNPESELSESQNEWMYRLLYKYRKQLPKTYEKYKSSEFCKQKK